MFLPLHKSRLQNTYMIHVLVTVYQVITFNLLGLLQACSQIHYIMFELNLFNRVLFILLFL